MFVFYRAPGNDRGEFKTGELMLYVHDSNGLPMGSDPSINSGDPVQFLVKLKEDGESSQKSLKTVTLTTDSRAFP